ncbi:MAG: hypothetical protein SH817_05790 [Leptospira sp.]|nr:hypothetical protein [Leptospira sp.]
MFQKKNLIYISLALITILCLSILFLRNRNDETTNKFKELSESKKVYDSSNLPELPENYEDIDFNQLTPEQIARIMLEKYGKNIDNARVQIALLEELMKDLPKLYPDNWVEKLHEILNLAFPDRALELFRMSEKLYSYNKFRENNMTRLGLMSDSDRKKEMWKERYRLFGEKADEIWAMEKKMQNVSDALKRIEESPTGNVDAKLNSFKSTLKENFGKELPQVLEKRQQTLTEGFISSVQKDLKTMSYDSRKSTLRDIREAMGMDQAALNRWDALEDERETKWQNLEKYKELRTKLYGNKTTISPEQQKEIDVMRTKLFGEEAEIIKNEEASGYFRSPEERNFGIN